jgi:membrane protease YdiL (CAAX protease family)
MKYTKAKRIYLSEIGGTSLRSKASAILIFCIGLGAILGVALVAALAIGGVAVGVDAFFHRLVKIPSLLAALESNGRLYFGLALSYLIYISLIIGVIGVAWMQEGANWRDLVAWRPWRAGKRVWLIVGATAAYGFCADFALSTFFPDASAHFTMPSDLSAAIALSLLAVIFAPIAEELAFRGWIFTLLRRNFSFPATLLFSSAVFASLHYESTHLYALAVFPIGLALGAIRETTGSIRPAMVFHALNNLIACGLSLLA